MEDFSIFQIITAIVAVLGFFLSIFSLYIQQNDRKPSIKVTTSYSFVTSQGLGIISPDLFSTNALNVGHVPVHLSGCGILLPDKKLFQFVGPDQYTEKSLPKTLLPGESITISRSLPSIMIDLKNKGNSGDIRVYSYFRDQIDNTYDGKKYTIKLPIEQKL